MSRKVRLRMVITTYRCDCCNKEKSESEFSKVSMPIIAHYKDGDRLMVKDMDFCTECAIKFVRLYYDIANEHNYSGIQAIVEG